MRQNDNQTHDDTSGYESVLDQSTEEMNAEMPNILQPQHDSAGPSRLIVKMPTVKKVQKEKAQKKLNARSLSRAHKKIKRISLHNDNLKRKVKAQNRKMQRLIEKHKSNPVCGASPRRQSEIEVRNLNLTPRRRESTMRRKFNPTKTCFYLLHLN